MSFNLISIVNNQYLFLGPPRIPILGSYWALLKEDYYFSHKSTQILAKRYNTDILGLFLGSAPTIVTFGYDVCKEVLSKEEFLGRNDTILNRGRSSGELLGKKDLGFFFIGIKRVVNNILLLFTLKC